MSVVPDDLLLEEVIPDDLSDFSDEADEILNYEEVSNSNGYNVTLIPSDSSCRFFIRYHFYTFMLHYFNSKFVHVSKPTGG